MEHADDSWIINLARGRVLIVLFCICYETAQIFRFVARRRKKHYMKLSVSRIFSR